MKRRQKAPKVSKEAVKRAAERAEARSDGKEPEDRKVPITPTVISAGVDTPEHAEPEVAKPGRPTAYDPAFDAKAEEMCLSGATDDQLAEEFGVSTRTINRWKVAQPTFRQSIKDAKDVADERVQRMLYHKAMGIEYEETQPIKLKRVVYVDGKRAREEEYVEMVTVRKFLPPDTTANIFWMKNRRRKDWQDVQKHEHGEPGDFDQMSDEELESHIKAEAEALMTLSEAGKSRKSTRH